MELDTVVPYKLPLLCVISLNGGWTADPERNKPHRDLGDTRYVQTDCGNLHRGRLLQLVARNRPSLAHRCRQGSSTASDFIQ